MNRIKKTVSLLLAALMVFTVCGGAFAETIPVREVYSGTCGAQGDNLTWTFYTIDGVLSIKGSGKMASWSSASAVPWHSYAASTNIILIYSPVTSIGRYAFCGCSAVASVTIPSGVTSIGSNAFEGCTSLSTLTIGSNVTSIGERAFYGCSSLTSVEIPSGVKTIYSAAFSGCGSLSSALFLGAPPSSFGSGVFDGCAEGFTIYYTPEHAAEWSPNGETTWNGYPIALAEMTSGACGDNLTWALDTETGVLTISGTGTMYDYNETPAPWLEYASSITSLVIEEGVTSIGQYAFAGCGELISVSIPESVTHIGGGAFYDCHSLLGADLPSGIEEIEYDTFAFCYSLEYVTIPEGVTYIGYEAFAECMSLDGIILPDSLEIIDSRAFHDCSSLTSLYIPAGVYDICEQVFIGCFSLPAIEVDPDNQWFSSYDGVLFNKDMTELIFCPAGKTGDYVVPASVTTIREEAFYECNQLTSIILPEGLLTISDCAFWDCDSLTSIMIPESVSAIGGYAFCGCDSLEFILFLGGLNFLLGENAFEYCPGDMCICYTTPYEDTWNPDGTIDEWNGFLLLPAYLITYTGMYTGWEYVPHGWDANVPVCGYAGLHYAFYLNGEPWDVTNVTGDAVVNVTLEADVYTVLFIDGYTGEVIAEMHAYYGQGLEAPEAPEHDGCNFLGWDGEFDFITGDTTVTALYEELFCTVTFVGAYNGEQQVLIGGDAELPVYDSATVCYTFTVDGEDWCPEGITEDVTVTVGAATVYSTYHTVTFIGMNGEELSVQQVRHGLAAAAPEAPEIEGYTFVGWDRDNFDCVTYSMTRTAVYEPVHPVLPGDVDGDGQVSFTDVAALYLYLVGAGVIAEEYLPNADYNGDGEVSFVDISDMSIMLIG